MTKLEVIKLWQEATGITQKQAAEYLERLGDIIAAELLGGGEVPLPRVGKITVVARAARKGRNPRTGEVIDIPASKGLKITTAKDLRESLA